MGVAITSLLVSDEIKAEDLSGKILAVDAFNTLYTFLTTIRGADGSPLMDDKGRITSHLVGILSRFSNLMEKGIKFIFVFDGESPELKKTEKERRKEVKLEAKKLYEEAKQKEDIENMKKYAARSVFMTKEMIAEAKRLIKAMGIPIVEAPSEGEVQAAFMVKRGDAYAVLSQDADSLLSGGTRTIRNLSITKRRKMPGSYGYKTIQPEIIELKKNLDALGLTQDQLIVLAILIGTDYNYGGVKGIGPKKGIKLVQKYGDNFDELFKEIAWEFTGYAPWKKIFDTIKNMPVTKDYEIKFNSPNEEEIKKLLVEEHNFSVDRVNSSVDRLISASKLGQQKGLSEFF